MTPELQQYVDGCRAHGMDDAAIRTSLRQTGWTEEQLQSMWPVSAAAVAPPVPATPTAPTPTPVANLAHHTNADDAVIDLIPQRKPRRWVIPTVIVLGVVILLAGTGIALGEAGYAPGISKIYRKTNLPLAWKGTVANPSITLGQAILATVGETKLKTITSVTGTLTSIDPAAATKIGLQQLPDGQTLADVPNSVDETFSGSFTFTLDTEHGIQASESFDIPDNLRPALEGYVKNDFKTLTFEGILPNTGSTAYARTNVLPTPTSDDVDKWFAIPLPSQDSLTSLRDSAKKSVTEPANATTRNDLMAIVNATTKDKGVVRHSNKAAAWYQTVINPEVLKALSVNPAISESMRNDLKDSLESWQSGPLTLDWFVDAHMPRLMELVIQGDFHSPYASFQEKANVLFAYGAEATVTNPAQLWKDVETYFQTVKDHQQNLFSTGAFTQEAVDSLMQFASPAEEAPVPTEGDLPGVFIDGE